VATVCLGYFVYLIFHTFDSPQNDMKTANATAPGRSKVAADVHLYRPQVSSTRVKPQKPASHCLVGHKIHSATGDFGSQMSWLDIHVKRIGNNIIMFFLWHCSLNVPYVGTSLRVVINPYRNHTRPTMAGPTSHTV
jgi:hypothetical protein